MGALPPQMAVYFWRWITDRNWRNKPHLGMCPPQDESVCSNILSSEVEAGGWNNTQWLRVLQWKQEGHFPRFLGQVAAVRHLCLYRSLEQRERAMFPPSWWGPGVMGITCFWKIIHWDNWCWVLSTLMTTQVSCT